MSKFIFPFGDEQQLPDFNLEDDLKIKEEFLKEFDLKYFEQEVPHFLAKNLLEDSEHELLGEYAEPEIEETSRDKFELPQKSNSKSPGRDVSECTGIVRESTDLSKTKDLQPKNFDEATQEKFLKESLGNLEEEFKVPNLVQGAKEKVSSDFVDECLLSESKSHYEDDDESPSNPESKGTKKIRFSRSDDKGKKLNCTYSPSYLPHQDFP